MSLETIKTLVYELTTLHVTRGVQPSELVDNLFEDEYVESSARKTSAGLIFELTFTETAEEESLSKVTMRYTYDRNRHLVRVEQKVATKRFCVQWDRARAVQERIEKLEVLLSGKLLHARVARILATIPKDYLALAPRLQLVA